MFEVETKYKVHFKQQTTITKKKGKNGVAIGNKVYHGEIKTQTKNGK